CYILVLYFFFLLVCQRLTFSCLTTGPKGMPHWSKQYPFCGGSFQSPIDFYRDIIQFTSSLKPIEVMNYNLSSTVLYTLSNNGHSVKMSLPSSMYLNGLPYRYSATQLHLHWGNKYSSKGSEHTINGKRFAAELHILHFNSERYPSELIAMDKSDGLAALGVLIEIGAFNPAFENIVKYLQNVKYRGQQFPIPGFDIEELLPPRLDEFYRYEGSVTTPPCYTSVIWTVFRNTVKISREQLLTLQTSMYYTQKDEPAPLEMMDNYRHTQEPGDRIVFITFRQGIVLSLILAGALGALVVIAIVCFVLQRNRAKKQTAEIKGIIYKSTPSKDEENPKI
uniref:Carbonic anhydrase n=1 Tax=Latimeria chalumnae TaxID=7897 RepID=H3AUJ4_LATCH